MIQTYQHGDINIKYQVHRKRIKHIYFRYIDDVLHISIHPKYSEQNLKDAIERNMDKISRLIVKKDKKIVMHQTLWGNKLLEPLLNLNQYHDLLTDEIILKINELNHEIKPLIKAFGLDFVPIKIKQLKSKFGSCHTLQKYITINLFLAKLDPIYLKYVLLHEYAHFIVPNHSKKFYNVLDHMMGNHRAVQKNLRKHVISF
ncbi:Protein of uncharacterised function DUF45 [Acholeplasma oculi]|uniref:YgjP-like metallopeptidase domain-containing protein n=2 Tax=Acholeplasma oculi TaxID=35623 RepID=A0A061AHL9_9MOLU|nr:hypothetical protein of unknown function DUF45 [Acholeplasma oculi]SKC37053.1 hypothetical protein SAMN02745122_0459 [Acholeplasma oculi]SUT90789.1 Protein of uncharacterised function DUF45 [Acholeplasma oculi]